LFPLRAKIARLQGVALIVAYSIIGNCVKPWYEKIKQICLLNNG